MDVVVVVVLIGECVLLLCWFLFLPHQAKGNLSKMTYFVSSWT